MLLGEVLLIPTFPPVVNIFPRVCESKPALILPAVTIIVPVQIVVLRIFVILAPVFTFKLPTVRPPVIREPPEISRLNPGVVVPIPTKELADVPK